MDYTYKSKSKRILRDKQKGNSDYKRDIEREALGIGKRTSKNGNEYWEYRKNRTDADDYDKKPSREKMRNNSSMMKPNRKRIRKDNFSVSMSRFFKR